MKISNTLSKMLNDVKVPSDENIADINVGILEDAQQLSEDVENAGELLEGIDDTTEVINTIESQSEGLQSDKVSVRLLATRLTNAVKKLDSTFAIDSAGLQSDTPDTFLKDKLEEAKGIVSLAKDELTKVTASMNDKVLSLDTKIEDMKKYLERKAEDGLTQEDKKTETIEAIANLIDEVKDTSKDINESENVDTEVPAEVTDAADNISENLEDIKGEEASEPTEGEEKKDPANDDETDQI